MPNLKDPAARREFLKPHGIKERAKYAANFVRPAKGACESCAGDKPEHAE